jgi:hypothetical protein
VPHAITHEAASSSGCAAPRPTQIASQLPPKIRSAMRIWSGPKFVCVVVSA